MFGREIIVFTGLTGLVCLYYLNITTILKLSGLFGVSHGRGAYSHCFAEKRPVGGG